MQLRLVRAVQRQVLCVLSMIGRKKRRRTLYSSKQDKKLVKAKPKPKAPRCLRRDNSLPLGLEFEYANEGELY